MPESGRLGSHARGHQPEQLAPRCPCSEQQRLPEDLKAGSVEYPPHGVARHEIPINQPVPEGKGRRVEGLLPRPQAPENLRRQGD